MAETKKQREKSNQIIAKLIMILQNLTNKPTHSIRSTRTIKWFINPEFKNAHKFMACLWFQLLTRFDLVRKKSSFGTYQNWLRYRTRAIDVILMAYLYCVIGCFYELPIELCFDIPEHAQIRTNPQGNCEMANLNGTTIGEMRNPFFSLGKC